MSPLLLDLRVAVRQALKRPSFSLLIAAVLSDAPPLDPITYPPVLCGMLLVVPAACLAPASRAARVDPLVALRQE
jgi:hypothetical protein